MKKKKEEEEEEKREEKTSLKKDAMSRTAAAATRGQSSTAFKKKNVYLSDRINESKLKITASMYAIVIITLVLSSAIGFSVRGE